MTTRGKQEPTSHDYSYLAGVIDSDGCIGIYHWKENAASNRYVLTITIVNTSYELMEWLQDKFGGSCKTRRKVKENHKTTYAWSYNNARAADLLKKVKNFLIVKKAQAINGIEFIEGKPECFMVSKRLSDTEIKRREHHIYIQKQLNQLGTVQPQRLNFSAPVLQDDAIV